MTLSTYLPTSSDTLKICTESFFDIGRFAQTANQQTVGTYCCMTPPRHTSQSFSVAFMFDSLLWTHIIIIIISSLPNYSIRHLYTLYLLCLAIACHVQISRAISWFIMMILRKKNMLSNTCDIEFWNCPTADAFLRTLRKIDWRDLVSRRWHHGQRWHLPLICLLAP